MHIHIKCYDKNVTLDDCISVHVCHIVDVLGYIVDLARATDRCNKHACHPSNESAACLYDGHVLLSMRMRVGLECQMMLTRMTLIARYAQAQHKVEGVRYHSIGVRVCHAMSV